MSGAPIDSHGLHVVVETRVATDLVVQLFSSSPPSWIRPALTLTSLGTPALNPRFELGRSESDAAGTVTIPLAWSPDQGSSTFRQFTGLVVIKPRAGGRTEIGLAGICTDGEPNQNRATLERVLRRIVRALEDVFPLSTPQSRPAPRAKPPRASSERRACGESTARSSEPY